MPNISANDAIRVHAPEGFRPAEYIQQHEAPNSHMIKAGDQARTYQRNRNKLMVTKETPHIIQPAPATYIPYVPPHRCQHQQVQQNTTPPNVTPSAPTQPPTPSSPTPPSPKPPHNVRTTRFGRQIRQPVWRDDYVT